MLTQRTRLRSAVAALGIGAVIALCSPATPALAANEGDHWISAGNCLADQKVQLTFVNGAWHDEQELNPINTDNGQCQFVLTDNGALLWESNGAGSNWWPDGPGHKICAIVYPPAAQRGALGICN
ncbi:hypothetical protein C7C46_00170 [Streptomyces tateyamensis]|uniref:Uncharacterized protein n=1 Tax=Streptomyces tateyamensis TaxID=565073 RepID=A0A2V4NRB3_9ACTN|nr:hypothetical protein [Streptomyces tateyamensis]PYC88532.1 hypothetical protein C7C46_00170 [Streptomyces tateyamensis]